jgi:hypothetical protein
MANVSIAVKVSVALLAIAALVATHLSISKVHYITRRGWTFRYQDGLSVSRVRLGSVQDGKGG